MPNQKIFVIHGPHETIPGEIIAFLKQLNVEPIFTLDAGNSAKTLNVKATENTEVQHAIVILSADNFFYPKDGKPSQAFLTGYPRVIFEFGFWLGRLGRDRVAAVYYDQKSFRLPSETFDALYIPFNKQKTWKTELAQRLKQWGFSVENIDLTK